VTGLELFEGRLGELSSSVIEEIVGVTTPLLLLLLLLEPPKALSPGSLQPASTRAPMAPRAARNQRNFCIVFTRAVDLDVLMALTFPASFDADPFMQNLWRNEDQ
jgi:hypothetical protein